MNKSASGTIDLTLTESFTTPIRLILFDLGGVLVSLTPQHRSNCFVKEFGIDQDRFQSFLVSAVPDQFNTGKLSSTEFHQEAQQYLGVGLRESIFKACWLKLIGDLKAENMVITSSLRNSGFRVGVLSNTDPWHWEHIRDLTPAFADFDPVFTSFELGVQKPDGEIFSAICDIQSLDPAEILLIDDSAVNLEAAEHAGWQVHHLVDNKQLAALANQLTGQSGNDKRK
jgi:glucose-1-phosphatase